MINRILVLQPLLTCFGFPRWLSGKEYTCQCKRCKRCRFDPRVETTLWRREWQPTLIFSPGESPRTEEPEGLQSIGLLERVRYNWGTEHACLLVFLQHELDMSSWCSGVWSMSAQWKIIVWVGNPLHACHNLPFPFSWQTSLIDGPRLRACLNLGL